MQERVKHQQRELKLWLLRKEKAKFQIPHPITFMSEMQLSRLSTSTLRQEEDNSGQRTLIISALNCALSDMLFPARDFKP